MLRLPRQAPPMTVGARNEGVRGGVQEAGDVYCLCGRSDVPKAPVLLVAWTRRGEPAGGGVCGVSACALPLPSPCPPCVCPPGRRKDATHRYFSRRDPGCAEETYGKPTERLPNPGLRARREPEGYTKFRVPASSDCPPAAAHIVGGRVGKYGGQDTYRL